MRVTFYALVLCLLLVPGGAFAQMDQDQNLNQDQNQMQAQNQAQGQPSFIATVQQGPVLTRGRAASADVFVNGRLAMRIGASAAGMTPRQRAQMIADRLNRQFAAGANWNDTRVAQVNSEWTVTLGNNVIATATPRDARLMHTQTGPLAGTWARQTVLALGGMPSMIASQLAPVTTQVAGAQQQTGVPGMVGAGAITWSNTPTKSVPLLDAATGNSLGSVKVGGNQARLNMVNSVIAYQTMNGNTTVWTFVPVTGTSTTGTLTRVMGVGLVSVPTSLINTSTLMTGNAVMTSVGSNATRWNSAINTALGQNNLRIQGNTKVVPLYSTDMNQVIGAVQIVGSSRDVADTQAVMVNTSGGMYMFNATNAACAMPMSGTPATLNGVVISAIILMPSAGTAPGTSGAGPGMEPGTTTPVAPGEVAPGTTSPDMNQPESAAPGTSGTGTGTEDNTGTGMQNNTGTETTPPEPGTQTPPPAPPESGTVTP